MDAISIDVCRVLAKYFGCPPLAVDFRVTKQLSAAPGFFRVGEEFVGYGRVAGRVPAPTTDRSLEDVSRDIEYRSGSCWLPFNPIEVIDNFRLERYANALGRSGNGTGWMQHAYYWLRPFMSVSVRKHLQRRWLHGWEVGPFPQWPTDRNVDRLHEWLLGAAMRAIGVRELPFIWFWPEGWPACAVITHDVETAEGRDFSGRLMDLNDSHGIKTSFQVVPEERYEVSESYLNEIRNRGFEINIHDLNHDGRLFSSRQKFLSRVATINAYGKRFTAAGFRSGALYRNLEWMDALQFEYDMSVPSVARLDPQPGGCCTIMPYFVGDLLELPVTTVQDYSLFHILGQYSIDLWKQQMQAILEGNGLINTIVHPDYLLEKRAEEVYRQLLVYLSELRSAGRLWIALPNQVNHWWRCRAKMRLVVDKGTWRIEGQGGDRARIAFARLEDGRVSYRLAGTLESRLDVSSSTTN